jgi:phage shock protein PspC (stress-responsive transcriptional regulator)
MKKIININFHGRVIPIEETAHDILNQYIESLRKHFAGEEGRDEIINDIENRFAELFSERLKKDSTCITDEDVNAIILSMGRPEDLEQEEFTTVGGSTSTQSSAQQQRIPEEPRRLYRAENDKVLGGVCGGLANYLRIDPAIVRIIFALISFGGFGSGIIIYIIMWIVIPSKTLSTNIRKRLYRNPDNRVIGGVASGLAAYFHWDVWIPRLIFSFPLILGVITSIFRHTWFDFDPAPAFLTGGLGGAFLISYIILWIVLPEAITASEKLEMRGEKIDLESIKNTIKSDMEGFKGRAKDMGAEIKERAQQFGTEVKQVSQNFGSQAGPVMRRTSSGLGQAIGVLFKAFFLFVAGVFSFFLIIFLIGLLFSGVGFMPFRNYFLAGFWQNLLAWMSLVLFFCIPVISLLTWLIRRIMGVRSKNNYLGYIFGSLWIIGLISLIIFTALVVDNFRTRASVEDEIAITQPSPSKLVVRSEQGKVSYYGSDWFGFNWDNNGPFYSLNEDSVMMTTVRINLIKSADSNYHLRRIKFSRGNSPLNAKDLASQIQFDTRQDDTVLYLPQGFAITPKEKFRNQQVLLVVEIPVGKRIVVDRTIDDYRWFNLEINRRHRGWNINWNDDWDQSYSWEYNVEYVMTENGLETTGNKVEDKESDGSGEAAPSHKGGEYRYKSKKDSLPKKNQKEEIKTKDSVEKSKSVLEIKTAHPALRLSETPAIGRTDDEPAYPSSYILSISF